MEQVLVGLGSKPIRKRERFTLGGVTKKLPDIKYDIVSKHEELELTEHYLGWLLSQYNFTNYVKQEQSILALVRPAGIDGEKIEKIAQGEVLTRDLVNTPANDMGPTELEKVIRDLAKMHGASVNTMLGLSLIHI